MLFPCSEGHDSIMNKPIEENTPLQKKKVRRLNRELKTVKAMITIYCRSLHGKRTGLCDECIQLEEYAVRRLSNCPFLADKPTCARCSIHCYKPDMKQKIVEVMRFSGPRMLFRHPILAVMHLLDEKKCA